MDVMCQLEYFVKLTEYYHIGSQRGRLPTHVWAGRPDSEGGVGWEGQGGAQPGWMKMWSSLGHWWPSSNNKNSPSPEFVVVAFCYAFLQLSLCHWLAWQVRPKTPLASTLLPSILSNGSPRSLCNRRTHRPLQHMVLAYSSLSKCALRIIGLLWFSSFPEDYNS